MIIQLYSKIHMMTTAWDALKFLGEIVPGVMTTSRSSSAVVLKGFEKSIESFFNLSLPSKCISMAQHSEESNLIHICIH
jgi:hypothetical protein